MKLHEIKEILTDISFSPSNLDMGWDWDICSTKLYSDNNAILEKGYSIRTTFMRPDIHSGEIEKGYGRWMYVPENISIDGLVKTAWVCAELIVKHELMEAFLFEKKRIFDPHKSIKDLQYSSNNDKSNEISTLVDVSTQPLGVIEDSNIDDDDDVIEKKEDNIPVSSDKLFHKQNINNHIQEITDYLDDNLIKKDNRVDPSMKSDIDKYAIITDVVFHDPKKQMVRLVSSSNGKILDHRDGDKYTLSDVKDMLNDMVIKSYQADSAVVNQKIYNAGFTEGIPKEDFWIFKHPKIKHRLVVHSEVDKSLAIINQDGGIVSNVDGSELVYENEFYTMDNIKYVLDLIKR